MKANSTEDGRLEGGRSMEKRLDVLKAVFREHIHSVFLSDNAKERGLRNLLIEEFSIAFTVPLYCPPHPTQVYT